MFLNVSREIPPVNTSKLIETKDSIEIFSHRSKTVSTDSSDATSEVVTRVHKHITQKCDKPTCFDFKPKPPKYFRLNLRRDSGRIPYKEVTDEDIDQLFDEYEAKHPSLLQKHLPKVIKEGKKTVKPSYDFKFPLKDQHYAHKLASLPIRDVLDVITTVSNHTPDNQ